MIFKDVELIEQEAMCGTQISDQELFSRIEKRILFRLGFVFII